MKQRRLRRHLWVLALAAALGFVAADGASRMRAIQLLTDLRVPGSAPPAEDPESPSGYALGVRNLVLPNLGVDGYHWILQTQRMLAGDGARIRWVDYDDAPHGREVHWSSSFRWWLAGLAWLHSKASEEPLAISVERVAPYASTLLLAAILLTVTPLVAWRFGALPAVLFVLALPAVHPVYELFATGYPDHHGMAAVFGMLAVLFLVAGGAGWLYVPHAGAKQPAQGAWLPDRRCARRWFIASALAGGAGLWVSASATVPVLIGIGLGAVAAGLCARGARHDAESFDPTLFRVWGAAGFCASLAFYLLEYFPSHFGIRLEVNHPFYALAWLGAGDWLCRACRWLQGGRWTESRSDLLGAIASLLAVAILPACLVLARERTFVVSDPFLWMLHEDYINEFRGLFRQIRDNPIRATLASYSLLPLLGVPMLALAASARLARPWKALLLFALLPGVVTFALAVGQSRWLGTSCAVWLAALVTTSAATTLPGTGFRWTLGWKLAAAMFLIGVYLPFPYFVAPLQMLASSERRAEISFADLTGVASRDVAHRLRHRLGDRRGIVASGPTVTTSLIHHGGLDGVGTLYWENIEGLKAMADLFGAPSEGRALELIEQRGITHIVVFSWDPFVEEYARLARGLRAHEPAPADAFALRLVLGFLERQSLPRWLRPIAHALPPDAAFQGHWVLIFEVAPEQTEDVALVRVAQFLMDKGMPREAESKLRLALERDPRSLPASIALASLQSALGRTEESEAALERVRAGLDRTDELDLDDRVDLARVLTRAGDTAEAAEQIDAALAIADERSLRRLRPAALHELLELADQLQVSASRPQAVRAAADLLDPGAAHER
jgi:hypothetical protein